MDWALAIDRNHRALLRLVAMMFAAAGLVPGASVARLPQSVRAAILFVLRPAESAGRRLIVVYNTLNAIKVALSKPRAKCAFPAEGIARGAGESVPPFPLFDTRKRFEQRARRRGRGEPRISGFDETRSVEETPDAPQGDSTDAMRLSQRLLALHHALEDLPKQALRLARALARRQRNPRKRAAGPLRANKPPGHRKRQVHEIDEILSDCDMLARMTPPDTS